jgi:glycine cleavage system aminomethyltransferase T
VTATAPIGERDRSVSGTGVPPSSVVLGKKPVYVDGSPAGYVTSASYGSTLGRCVAYVWLPPLDTGTGVHIEHFGEKVPATVADEPLFDPKMERIRR